MPYKNKKDKARYMRKWRKSGSKLSNAELIAVARAEYHKMQNPTIMQLVYKVMAVHGWKNSKAYSTASMLAVVDGLKFAEEKTEQTEKTTEYEELKRMLKIIGKFDDKEVKWLMTFPDSWKQELREIYEDHVHRVVVEFREKFPEKYEEYRRLAN